MSAVSCPSASRGLMHTTFWAHSFLGALKSRAAFCSLDFGAFAFGWKRPKKRLEAARTPLSMSPAESTAMMSSCLQLSREILVPRAASKRRACVGASSSAGTATAAPEDAGGGGGGDVRLAGVAG